MNELITYDVQEAVISEMQKYVDLTINGMEDKEGYKKVHDARMIVKNTRVKVEKRQKEIRKALKSQIEKDLAACDEEAKRLLELLNPIEEDLNTKEQAINVQIDEIKNRAKREAEAETERLRLEELERLRVQAESQEAERLRLDAIRIEQEKAAQAIKDAQDKIDREKREIEHAKEIERVKAETEERAKKEYDERIERERIAAEMAERQKVEHAERERLAKIEADKQAEIARLAMEAARPDFDKLLDYAEDILTFADTCPEVTSDKGRKLKDPVINALIDLSSMLKQACNKAKSLVPEPVSVSNNSEVDWS